jgi:hypothetical protein
MSKREIWRQAWAYWWIPASVAVVGAFIVAAWAYNPVQEAGDHLVAPAVGIGDGSNCPSGWDDTSDLDMHVQRYSCERVIDGVKWQVVLKDDGKTFDHGTQLDTPGSAFVYDASEVPLWRAR